MEIIIGPRHSSHGGRNRNHTALGNNNLMVGHLLVGLECLHHTEGCPWVLRCRLNRRAKTLMR
ncbi:MAG: hypothetical protein J6X70_07540 [Muribaculaceae bacterium]|nr:hypothetical protein [Muribaculaceae bacterium]